MAERNIPAGGATTPETTFREAPARLNRAWLYLDASAPGDAHQILEPVLEAAFLSAFPPQTRFDLLLPLLESCRLLGHGGHLDRLAVDLQQLCDQGAVATQEDLVLATALLVWNHNRRGEYEEAIRRRNQISPRTLSESSPKAAVRLLLAEADSHLRLGNHTLAEETIGRALEAALRGCDGSLEGNVRANMARVLKLRGRLTQALRLYNQAMSLHKSAGEYASVALDELNRATVLNRMGQLRDGRRGFQEARRRAREVGRHLFALRASIGLGMNRVRRGALAQARRGLLSDWREARRRGFQREECLSLEHLSEAELLNGRLPHARRALSLCNRLAARIAPSSDLIVSCAIRSAQIALLEQRWREAGAFARSAVELCVRLQLPWEEAQAQRLLGAALAMGSGGAAPEGPRESLEAARIAMSRSRALLEEMGEKLEIRLARRWLRLLDTPDLVQAVSRGDPIEWPAVHPSGLRRPMSDRAIESPPRCDREAAPQPAASVFGPPVLPSLHPVWRQLGFVTQFAPLLRLLDEARRLAQAGLDVLVLGETGTGKELVAQGIHQLGSHGDEPLVAFNCATCPPEMLDAELFGHVRGAFTGAHRDRPGLVRSAAGGTLFLDEVGELRAESQARLLRLFDTGEVRPVGSDRAFQVKVRIVAATNAPLEKLVAQGRFRPDLYFRLIGGTLALPPLRERRGDIPCLAASFVHEVRTKLRTNFAGFTARAMNDLQKYGWPGNVRQLRLEVFRLAALWPEGLAVDRWSPPHPETEGWILPADSEPVAAPADRSQLREILDDPQRLRELLRRSAGCVEAVSRSLGVSRSHLYRSLVRHRINPREFRASANRCA